MTGCASITSNNAEPSTTSSLASKTAVVSQELSETSGDSSTEIPQNDLVFRDTGTTLSLDTNSSLTLSGSDFAFSKDQSADLYLYNVDTKEELFVGTLTYENFLSYSSTNGGEYKLLAQFADGTIVDLSNQVHAQQTIPTDNEDSKKSGFIPLH